MDIAIYNDNDWDKVDNANSCEEKKQLAYSIQSIKVPQSGEYSASSVRRMNKKRQTKFWYFAAIDCEQQLWTQFPTLPRIEVEAVLYNDKSHFSHEDYGILTLSWIMTGIFTLLLG